MKIIFPKIKVRYGAASPKEYLDEADRDVIRGTSVILYQNDDTSIPALLTKPGISAREAPVSSAFPHSRETGRLTSGRSSALPGTVRYKNSRAPIICVPGSG